MIFKNNFNLKNYIIKKVATCYTLHNNKGNTILIMAKTSVAKATSLAYKTILRYYDIA